MTFQPSIPADSGPGALALRPIEAATLALPGVRHGFLTREGGVSTGLFAGLNAGINSGDDPAAIAENRRRIANHFGVLPENLLSLLQIHGKEVVTVDRPWPANTRPSADALVTATPGVALGIAAADCAPILLADPAAGVVGAAHAGWRGALESVTDTTIAAMERLGARRERIVAAIGPAISQEHYEVAADFRDRFVAADPANAAFFVPGPRPGHHQFDLNAYLRRRLERAGIGGIADLRFCTYADEARFYSFRRTTHRAEQDYGRQLSVIMLQA